MAYLRADKTGFDNQSNNAEEDFHDILLQLRIGEPALMVNDRGKEFYVWSDDRIGLKDVMRVGRDVKDAAKKTRLVQVKDIPLTEEVTHDVPVRVQVEHEWVDEETGETHTYLRWEDHPTDTHEVTEDIPLGDPYNLVLHAQKGPLWLDAFQSLPVGMVPADAEV